MSLKSLFDLSGRVAVVTGATGGIGKAIALTLAEAGAHVVASGRSGAPLAALGDLIGGSGGMSEAWVVDVNDVNAVSDGIELLVRAHDGIDILVNCAGTIARGSVIETHDEEWDQVLAINLSAPFRLCRAIAPAMLARGWGRIVNVGSALSIVGKANAASYVASKHGVAGLTRALAAELGPGGICVNALCPGYIRTEINRALQDDPAYRAKIEQATPLGRWGTPEDMAGPALFLCSEAAAYVNGHLLVADGGMTVTH